MSGGWQSPDPDYEVKKRFAEAWFRLGDAFAAGQEIYGSNLGQALWVSSHWVLLPEVLAMRDAVAAAQPDPELPDAEETAREAFLFFSNGAPFTTGKDRVAALKLYAELRGFIGKGKKENGNEERPLTEVHISVREDEPTS